MIPFSIERVDYDDPLAQKLIGQVQAEYAEIYGSGDAAPIDASEFRDGNGEFFIGFLDGEAVATGCWRKHDEHAAEIKRMYVVPHRRREGLSTLMLDHVERAIQAAGFAKAILETGSLQGPAVQMYRKLGYSDTEPFGYYKDGELAVHLGKELNK